MNADQITAIATVVAAGAAAWAGWQASKATKHSVELVGIERDRREDEARQQRAAVIELNVTRRTWNEEHGFEHVLLVISNSGQAAASPLNLRDLEGDPFSHRLMLEMFPLTLGAGSSVEAQSTITFGDDPRIDLEVTWTDGNGSHSEPRTVYMV